MAPLITAWRNNLKRADLQLRQDAIAILRSAIAAADAGNAVRDDLACRNNCLQIGDQQLPLALYDHTYLIAAGKASIEMASAVRDILSERLTGGVVVTNHGHKTTSLGQLTVFEAGHPIPDQAGVDAGNAIHNLMTNVGARDLLIVLISGGASSLLPAPSLSLTLGAKQHTTDLLLRCGAAIEEINAVPKHLSTLTETSSRRAQLEPM
jgi:glycerate-2-kinase